LLGKSGVLKTQVNKKGEDMKGKFGRILGDFIVGSKKVSQILCEEGFAVPYFGGSKDEVQMMHQANRKKLLKQGIVKL